MPNKGDTLTIVLNNKVNGSAMQQGVYDEIELALFPYDEDGFQSFTYTDNRVIWDTTLNKYKVVLTQEETFQLQKTLENKNINPLKFKNDVPYQVRIELNGQVGSCDIQTFELGAVLSNKVLGGN